MCVSSSFVRSKLSFRFIGFLLGLGSLYAIKRKRIQISSVLDPLVKNNEKKIGAAGCSVGRWERDSRGATRIAPTGLCRNPGLSSPAGVNVRLPARYGLAAVPFLTSESQNNLHDCLGNSRIALLGQIENIVTTTDRLFY